MMTPFRFLPVLALAAFFIPLLAAEADPAVAAPPASAPAAPAPGAIDATKIAGAEAVETKGQMTGLSFKDATTLTEADYKQIRKMEGLKSLAFAHGPDDASLKILSGMPAIETFTTNGAHLTDAGVATLATFPALQTLTFFHPGQVFTGTGLAALATLPHLESFSLGGSQKFTDAGLAAVATFPHLTALRIWHTAVTGDGVKALLALKLKSLMLGQTLDMKSKAALTDDSVAVVAQIASLETLNLSEARLSLAALMKLKQLPNLKRLTLDSIEISPGDVDALKQALPKVDIKWTAPTDTRRIDALFGPPKPAPAP
jgi:hypothetical protein